MNRRYFLKTVAGAGLGLGVSGCCTVTHLPPPKSDTGSLLIDPHCHIFNGRDLDIYNYLESDLVGLFGLTRPMIFVLTETIREAAPTVEEELEELDRLVAEHKQRLNVEGITAARSGTVDALRRLEAKARQKMQTVLQDGKRTKKPARKRFNPAAISQDSIDFLMRQHLPAIRQKIEAPGLRDFLQGFWQYRYVNAYRLQRSYPRIGLFTPALMDTDSWFQNRIFEPSESSSPLSKQVEVYERISILTEGKMLPFIAFDPRHQVEAEEGSPDAPMRVIEHALGKGNLVGLKLYPVMGYRPIGNEERDREAKPPKGWNKGLGKALDEVMAKAFELSIKEGFSCMAHTNMSHASEPEYLTNGHPDRWRSALEKHPLLKINLAHFGGMKNEFGWREGIMKLMADYPGVYADVADFSEITCKSKREQFVKDLNAWVALHPQSPLLQKLLYGSDYYMNNIGAGWERYADDWLSEFQQNYPQQWKNLTGGNAIEFLGLKSGKQRERLDRFMSKHNLKPDWMKLV